MPSYFSEVKIELGMILHKNTNVQLYSLIKDGKNVVCNRVNAFVIFSINVPYSMFLWQVVKTYNDKAIKIVRDLYRTSGPGPAQSNANLELLRAL